MPRVYIKKGPDGLRKNLNIPFTEDDYARLKAVSERAGQPKTVVAREAVLKRIEELEHG